MHNTNVLNNLKLTFNQSLKLDFVNTRIWQCITFFYNFTLCITILIFHIIVLRLRIS